MPLQFEVSDKKRIRVIVDTDAAWVNEDTSSSVLEDLFIV